MRKLRQKVLFALWGLLAVAAVGFCVIGVRFMRYELENEMRMKSVAISRAFLIVAADAMRGGRDDVPATRPGTPPGDVMCRGRSPGSRVNATVPAFPGLTPSDPDRQPLAAYSCGGSSGVAPASLLAPHRRTIRRTTTGHVSPLSVPAVK